MYVLILFFFFFSGGWCVKEKRERVIDKKKWILNVKRQKTENLFYVYVCEYLFFEQTNLPENRRMYILIQICKVSYSHHSSPIPPKPLTPPAAVLLHQESISSCRHILYSVGSWDFNYIIEIFAPSALPRQCWVSTQLMPPVTLVPGSTYCTYPSCQRRDRTPPGGGELPYPDYPQLSCPNPNGTSKLSTPPVLSR